MRTDAAEHDLARNPPGPPDGNGSGDAGAGGPSGFLATVIGFAGGWLTGYALAQTIAHRIASGSELQGFSGLALALSIAGFLRIGIVAIALIACFLVLRIRNVPGAGTTAILTLGAWWLVTALLSLVSTAGFRLWWVGMAVALVASPLIGRAGARQLRRRTSVWVAVALAVGGLIVSSFVSSAIGQVSSDRSVQDFMDQQREQEQIDFTPYLPIRLPAEARGEHQVIGPIVPPPSIAIVYGDASDEHDPHRVVLLEQRLPADPCGMQGPSGYDLDCTQIGALRDGTPVYTTQPGTNNRRTIWIARGSTLVVLVCLLEADQGCVRDDGTLNPQALLVLDSLTEAVYTPAEPLSGDDPVLELANP